MSYSRKIRRKKEKSEKKRLSKAVRQMSNRMEMIGDQCASCKAPLDKSDLSQLESWSVYQNKSGVAVVCPRCRVEIEELKEELRQAESQDTVDNA